MDQAAQEGFIHFAQKVPPNNSESQFKKVDWKQISTMAQEMSKVPANMFSTGGNEILAEQTIENDIGKIDLTD